MSEDKKTDSSEDDNILIDYPHVVVGMYLVRQNAKRIFQDGKFLYDNQKFQTSIPLFIISLEEALKSHEMAIKFRKKQSISFDDWANLHLHKHKLSYVSNFVIESIESMDEETTKNINKELGHDENLFKHRNEIIALNKAEKGIESHFQKLKELCLYQNWNKEFCEWDEFDRLSSEQKEDLAYFIMKKAEIHLHQLDMAIEMAVYVIRRDDFMIHDLEFPTYNELREPKNFETRNSHLKLELDHFKFHRGLKNLESLMIKKAFAVIDQIISHELIKKCLKLPPKNDLDNWYPHPVVKSIFNAMAALNEGKKDGNYAGMSGDADLTQSGEPMMQTFSGVSKKDGIIKIEKIMINGTEFSANDKVIEQILKTELIIDTHPGKEIPLEKMHQALAVIGLKMRKLRDDEIEPAISKAKLMIEQDRYRGMSEEIKQQIKLVTKQNWGDQDPNIRSLVGSAYGTNIIKDENTIVMTGQYDPLEKFKVRGMIYQMLMSRNEMKMGTS